MRLIDADFLKDVLLLHNYHGNNKNIVPYSDRKGYRLRQREVDEAIINAPTVDAIPISVIEDIKEEIKTKYDSIPYRNNDYDDAWIDALEWVLESVIDKHISRKENE